MRSFAQLLAVATAFTSVLAQYSDGYETVNSATDPVQIRLAYQGPTAMMVSWNTFSQLTNPTVSYGTSPGALTQTASSSVSVTYATSLTYNNHVNLTGLLPHTAYYYLPQYSNATTPYTFTTARAAGDTTPYTVGVVVDMGTFGALGLSTVVGTGAANPLAVNEQTTIASLTEMIDSYEFMVHAGDIAYADYWLKEEIQNYLPTTTTAQGAQVYESILNAFYDEMINITSTKAYMVNAGNHEANCDNGGTTNKTSGQKYTESICLPGQTNFTGYINHWRMPSGPSGGLGNFWYSYDYGMTHFIHIDTETDLGNGLVGPDEGSPEYGGPFGSFNQQINWLTNDLASVNRTLTPWVVVFGHRGWYLSASGSVCANCQTAFEKLFYTYDVDLYINGHAHLYERTAPIYNGVIDPNGLNDPNSTLYITNGAAGHYDGLDTFTTIQPYSVYHTASDYAWTTLTFTDSSHLTINTLWSANNTVFDSAVLFKNHTYIGSSSSTSTSSSTSSSSSISTSAISTTSTTPTTTTNTATTTSTTVFPSYTNFVGQGHLYVYTGGLLEGDIGSAGTWYNTPGQNTATYTAVPLYSNNTAFILQHSSNYCNIGSDFSFGCAATASGAATVFGQTADGNLTYNGSPAFYASSAASSGAKPTVYATPLAVSLDIVWGTDATTTAASTTSTSTSTSGSSTSSSSSPKTTGMSSTSSSSSSVITTTSSSSSISPTSTSSSSSSSSSSSLLSSSTSVSTATSTSSSSSATTPGTSSSMSPTSTAGTSISTVISSTTDTRTTTTSTIVTATFSTTTSGTETDSYTSTYSTTTSGTETDSFTSSTTTTATVSTMTSGTETDSFTVSTTTSGTETDSFTISTTATTTVSTTTSGTETDSFTVSTTTSGTEIDSFTVSSTTSWTETDSYTVSKTTSGTETDSATITISTTTTDTETDSATITIRTTTTGTEVDSTTVTLSTITTGTEIDSATVTIGKTATATVSTTTRGTETASTTQTNTATASVTLTQSTTLTVTGSTTTETVATATLTQPASTITSTLPASTVTSTRYRFTVTTTRTLTPKPVTVTVSPSPVTVMKPPVTVTYTQPPVTITKPPVTITYTQPVSTVTVTKSTTSTVDLTSTKPASTVTSTRVSTVITTIHTKR